jgi:hypothetical protein
MTDQERVDKLVEILLLNRELYIEKYITSLEQGGVEENFESMRLWNIVRDLDTHVKNLQTLAQPTGV